MPATLILYSTDHCALCDEALDMLIGMPALAGMRLEVVDVTHSDELFARYAEAVPVLALGDAELGAPFTEADVERWLRELGEAE